MIRLASAKLRWAAFSGLAVLFVGAAGCSEVHTTARPEDRPSQSVPRGAAPAAASTASAAEQQALFDKLTASRWCNERRVNHQAQLPDTLKSYEFAADGVYDWFHESDYLEGEGGGAWTFTASDARSGMIFLDSGDALRFAFADDGSLALEFEPLDACTPLTATGELKDLPRIKPSPLFQQITAHTWHRSGDAGLAFRPTSVTYRPDGTYTAEYRNGECGEVGSWSLREGQLTRVLPDQRCDARLNTNLQPNIRLRFPVRVDGPDLLVENGYYTAAPWKPGGVTTVAQINPGLYILTVSYPALQRGETSKLTVELTNLTRFDMTLQTLSVSELPDSQTRAAGVVVGRLPLDNAALRAGAAVSFTVDVAPQGSGETDLSVAIDAVRNRQPAIIGLSFEVDLGPP